MEFKAVQKYVRVSPKKLRYVSYLLKNMTPSDAILRLPFIGKRGAEPILKAVKAAVANAKQKGVSEKDLIFKEIQINEGPRLKRWRAGSRGRAKPYVRAMSHIRVVVDSNIVEKESVESKKESTKEAREVKEVKKLTSEKKEKKEVVKKK